MENFEELHISITFLLNCALAFPCLLVMSSSQSPVDVTTPPRYVNRSTPSIPCSLILTGVLILEFNHITLVKCLFKVNKALLPLLNPAGSSDSSFLHHLEFFESVFVKRLCLAQTEREGNALIIIVVTCYSATFLQDFHNQPFISFSWNIFCQKVFQALHLCY